MVVPGSVGAVDPQGCRNRPRRRGRRIDLSTVAAALGKAVVAGTVRRGTAARSGALIQWWRRDTVARGRLARGGGTGT